MRDLLENAGQRHPDKIALIYRDRPYSYGELSQEASRVAAGLQANFHVGDILAIWLPNGPELLILYAACMRVGIVPMPLHSAMKEPEVRRILAQSHPRGLITARAFANPPPAELHRIYALGIDRCVGTYRPFSELMQYGDSFEGIPFSGERVGFVLHTSGSNGQPKGVMHSCDSVTGTIRARCDYAKITGDSVALTASCLTQSVGLYQSLALLYAGGTIILLESYDIDGMVNSIHQHQPTHLIMVVDAFDKLLHHPGISSDSLRCILFSAVGADRVTPRVQNRFIALTGRPLCVSYGMTELSWALFNPGNSVEKMLALGKPSRDVEIKLVDDHGRDVEVGSTGEMYFRSPRVAMGFLRGNDDHVSDNGWLASGDLAYRDLDGYYWFAGRKKNMIVLSTGDNVSPVEVENAILKHPSVIGCAVAGYKAPDDSDVTCAFVTCRDQMLNEAELAAFLRDLISDFKVPQKYIFLSELPVGMTGKIQHDEIKKLLIDGAMPTARPR